MSNEPKKPDEQKSLAEKPDTVKPGRMEERRNGDPEGPPGIKEEGE